MRLGFATQSYKSRSIPVSAQRLVNAYTEQQIPAGKDQTPIFTVPGLVPFSSCGNGPVRGMWTMQGVLYVVSGGALYSVSSSGAETLLGQTIPGTGPVSMADNGTQLCIVNGKQGFIYTTSNGFQLITSVNFFPSNTVTFFDNYFVFDKAGTNEYFISNSLDGTTFSALDFASAAVNPDLVLATINQQENLLIFGQKTIETWYDSGDINFPFARYDGATIERGLAAPLATVKEDNSVFFLGNDVIFYRLNGVIPVRVSTHAIETIWRKYPTVTDAFCWSQTWEGHKWIWVTFPSGNATWVYDVATNLWFERESMNASSQSLLRSRINSFIYVYGKHIVGDAYSGQIGEMDGDIFTEYGMPMVATAAAPPIHSDKRRIFIPRFELDMDAGTAKSGQNPQVMLEWSKDGGYTFGPLQIWDSLGKEGEYTTRLRWLRLGQAREWVFRMTISDPVKRTVIASNVDIKIASG